MTRWNSVQNLFLNRLIRRFDQTTKLCRQRPPGVLLGVSAVRREWCRLCLSRKRRRMPSEIVGGKIEGVECGRPNMV